MPFHSMLLQGTDRKTVQMNIEMLIQGGMSPTHAALHATMFSFEQDDKKERDKFISSDPPTQDKIINSLIDEFGIRDRII